MDDLEDLQASEFVTDNEDQDSLDERIDTEQRLRNQQLWASFQNAACCITKLYKDRAQPNTTPNICTPWIPFQNAASNLTTLYKDCIESQRRFALIGYQIGRRKRMRELTKLLKKHKLTAKQLQDYTGGDLSGFKLPCSGDQLAGDQLQQPQPKPQQHNNQAVASILAVNQLSLGGCDELLSDSMQTQPLAQIHPQSCHTPLHLANQASQQHQSHQQPQQSQVNSQIISSNNDDDLVTFQQALAQPAALKANIKSNQTRRSCAGNQTEYFTNNTRGSGFELKSEEERLLELNQFLSEEYHRHVGSRKRSCSNLGGSTIKRFRE